MGNERITMVIPLYNEAETITALMEVLTAVFNGVDYTVLLVDDGSTDATWSVIQKTAESFPRVSGIRFSRNFGKECAVFAGLVYADGDCVIVMDGDMQHPPETALAMFQLWLSDRNRYQIVEAVKKTRQKESVINKICADAFYAALQAMSGISLKNMSDFKLLDKSVVDILRAMPERYTFFRAMTGWTGLNTGYVYFDVAPRYGGKTKFKPLGLIRLAVDSMASYSSVPLQMVTLTGFGFVTFAVIMAVQTLYMKIFGKSVEGFTTVILLLLLIGGILMLSLGIIGVYIAKIYNEVKMRPRYIISQRIRLDEK